MPAKRLYDPERSLVEFEWSGSITVEDVIEEEAEFFDEEPVEGALRILCDFTAVETVEYSRGSLGEMIDNDEEVASGGVEVRCAIVAANDYVFGLSRMFEQMSSQRPGEVSVFRREDEARRWLFDE